MKTDDESDNDNDDIEEDCDSDAPNESVKSEPLHKLLQDHSTINLNAQTNCISRSIYYPDVDKHQQYSPLNGCGRPFCKLKKRDHFHCNICNQV